MQEEKIINYYYYTWVDLDKGVIEYRNDYSGRLTSIDFVDSNGIF